MNSDNLNKMFAAIIESSEDAILSKTLEGIITSWNKAAERLYGYSSGEMIGQSIIKIFPPERKNELSEILKKLSSGERIERYETTRLRKDGKIVNVSLTISPIRDENGKVSGASAIARDITRQKLLEAERMLKEQQLTLAQQIANLGYWEWDLVSGKLEWSDELYKIYGRKKSEWEATFENYFECIYHEDRKDVRKIIDASLINYQPFRVDHRIILPNKVIRYIHGIGEFLLDSNRKPLKVRGVAQDVSEFKRIERRLASQFEVTRVLAESKSLAEAAPKIIQAICEGVDWLIGEFWLADYKTNLLHLEANWHKQEIQAKEFIEISRKCKFGPGVSLQGQVWESMKPIWSTQAVSDQFFPRAALAAKLRLHTALAFPVVCKKKVIGVVAFYKDDITEPDNELLDMLDSLGKQIGDFIERKQSEPALRESESLYRTLVEISPDSISYTDLSGKIIFCNQQTAELFGFGSIDEMIGHNMYAFIAAEDQEHAIENEHNIIETGRTRNVEYTLIQKNGAKFPAEVNTSIGQDAEGKPKAFIEVIRNISSRKKIEKELNSKILQQAAIADFGLDALSGMEINKLLNKAAEIATKTLDLEFCEVLELLPDGDSFVLTSGVGWTEGSVGKTKLKTGQDSHAGFTLLSSQPVICENYLTEKRFNASKLLKEHNVISGITVLIHGRNKPFGVLGAHSAKAKTFTWDDSHFLQAISNIIAAAVERKAVENELAGSLNLSHKNQLRADESRKRLSFLAEASGIFNSSLDYHKTLSAVANLLTPELADWCVIDLLQEDGSLKHAAISHKDPQKIEIANELEKKYKHYLDSFRRVYYVARTGRSEFYSSIEESIVSASIHKDEYLHFIKEFGVKSAMIVPLKLREQVLGVISFISTKPDFHYSNPDLLFAEDIAGRAASAIENARLYREANIANIKLNRKTHEQKDELNVSNTELEVETKLRRKKSEELEDLHQRQTLLMDFSLAAIKENDIDRALLLGVKLAATIPGARRSNLFKFDAVKNKMILIASSDQDNKRDGTLEVDMKLNTVEGFALKSDEQFFCADLKGDQKFYFYDEMKDEIVIMVLCVPLKVRQANYGIISVYLTQCEYSEADKNFIITIAKILSSVVEAKDA